MPRNPNLPSNNAEATWVKPVDNDLRLQAVGPAILEGSAAYYTALDNAERSGLVYTAHGELPVEAYRLSLSRELLSVAGSIVADVTNLGNERDNVFSLDSGETVPETYLDVTDSERYPGGVAKLTASALKRFHEIEVPDVDPRRGFLAVAPKLRVLLPTNIRSREPLLDLTESYREGGLNYRGAANWARNLRYMLTNRLVMRFQESPLEFYISGPLAIKAAMCDQALRVEV